MTCAHRFHVTADGLRLADVTDADQFYVEIQVRVRRDRGWSTVGTVASCLCGQQTHQNSDTDNQYVNHRSTQDDEDNKYPTMTHNRHIVQPRQLILFMTEGAVRAREIYLGSECVCRSLQKESTRHANEFEFVGKGVQRNSFRFTDVRRDCSQATLTSQLFHSRAGDGVGKRLTNTTTHTRLLRHSYRHHTHNDNHTTPTPAPDSASLVCNCVSFPCCGCRAVETTHAGLMHLQTASRTFRTTPTKNNASRKQSPQPTPNTCAHGDNKKKIRYPSAFRRSSDNCP